MKIQCCIVDITPFKPVMQGGYRMRDKPFQAVHDAIEAVVYCLTIDSEKYFWVSADISNGTGALQHGIIGCLAAKGFQLAADHMIFAGSHTHSGPDVYVDREPFRADREYFAYICEKVAAAIIECSTAHSHTVLAAISKIQIDGLYSNRNSRTKPCDKSVNILGFFEQEKLIAMFVNLSHHCTVLGPNNYMLSGDLFGAMRRKLAQHYGCYVMMAQGNAADMGNRQYRSGNGFQELEKQSSAIVQQIFEKLAWTSVDIDGYEHHRYVLPECFEVDTSAYSSRIADAEETISRNESIDSVKLAQSALRGYQRKIELGEGKHNKDMPCEIINMHDLQLVVLPCELGSILGMRIKAASPAKHCIVWGYANGADLGYLVEAEAYDEDSFESRISVYPAGVGDDYTSFIIAHLDQ